ncbi:alpha/beta hydrolase family protein [Bacillus niameyensis]|uniref:alpha/beta hydrolase family protein n=1 Tax=Bacillus niameyensis TaxID=1522308 RepID=UPI0007862F1F|nr:prolyl oligopeptidase family serine peptidase [Bacillus niameyensis]
MSDSNVIVEQLAFPSPNPHVKLSLITYLSRGLKVKGMLAEPIEDGKYDGFLYLRGGIKGVGMVRPARIAQFASEGFVVFAPFYRGNWGGEGNEDFAGTDRHDAFAGFKILKSLSSVNPERIHIFGFSRGGVMALLTGIEYPEAASVVTWGGVSDVALTYEEREDLRRMMKRVIGGSPNTATEQYDARNPLTDLGKLDAPILIIHGEQDHNVSIEHAKKLEGKLSELGRKFDTWYFHDFTHYFPPATNRKVVKDLCQWMKKQKR